MGNSCGLSKKTTKENEVRNPPEPGSRRMLDSNQPDFKEACIGPYLTSLTKTIKSQQRLEKWNKMYNMYNHTTDPLYNYARDRKRLNKFKRRVCKGPPSKYRWSAWCAAVGLKSRINVTEYHNLSYANEDIQSVIQRDLDRTFPEHPYLDLSKYGEIGQESLKRILSKFANKHSDIEYCQGMNFVAGFLLLMSGGNEVESFYMLELMCSRYSIAGFYIESMPELKKCIFVFNCLFQKFLPKLYRHFTETEVPSDLWISKWIMTIFTMTLSFDTIVRVWDLLFIKGFKIVYQVALALLFHIRDKLIELDLASIANILRIIKNASPNPEALIKRAIKFKVTQRKLAKLRKLYEETTALSSPVSSSKITTVSTRLSQTTLKIQTTPNPSTTQAPAQTVLYEEIPRKDNNKRSYAGSSASVSSSKNISGQVKLDTLQNENFFEPDPQGEHSETLDVRSLLRDSNTDRPSVSKRTHRRREATSSRENVDIK
jgi:hypothetical protein